MTTGGSDVDPRVWALWTVAGMHDFLARELENREHPDRAHDVSDPEAVTLLARFDPKTGVPVRFLRHIRGQTAGIEWAVTSFEKR
jgi:hypothetical protein